MRQALRASPAKLADGASFAATGLDKVFAVYVAVWILEGAARKWLPGASLAGYVGHDVIALVALAVIMTRPAPAPRRPAWVLLLLFSFFLWGFMQLVATTGAGRPSVFLIGIRSYVGPILLPIISVYGGPSIARLRLMAAALLFAAPLELLISVLQVISPASALINLQVGGAETDFVNAGDVVRASGTFSSPSGLTAYLTLAACAGLAYSLSSRRSIRAVAFASVLCTLSVTLIGGSRGSVLQVSVVVAVFVLHLLVSRGARGFANVVLALVVFAGALYSVSAALPAVIDSFSVRIAQASASEDSFARLLQTAFGALESPPPLLGSGFGTHSNAGILVGSGSAWVEDDGFRWVAELGFFGYGLVLLRLVVALACAWFTFEAISARAPASAVLARLACACLAETSLIGSVNENPTLEAAFGISAALVLAYREVRPIRRGSVDSRGIVIREKLPRPARGYWMEY